MTTPSVNAAPQSDALMFAVEIVAAYVGNNSVSGEDIPALLGTTFTALRALETQNVPTSVGPQIPAVPISDSITDDFIICLEDGKKLKMLKRYLRTQYGMSPEAYKQKWQLPADYPLVAPNYAKRRSDFAKQIGLGKTPSPTAKKARRKKKAGS